MGYMSRVLVITGPTGVGKTKLGILLAEKFNGEIISADSRQVYKYMDIGTGKDVANFQFTIYNLQSISKFSNIKFTYGYYDVNGIKIWGLDIVEPDYAFNVSDYVNYANGALEDIWKRGKLPIIVGGTGQYIKELFWPSETLHIPVDQELRSKDYKLEELQDKLKEIDINKWGRMNNSDRNNPRRLIRAIEVAGKIASPQAPRNDILIIGLMVEELEGRIRERVKERFRMGIEKERESLKNYRLPKTIGYQNESIDEWISAECKYAKKQLNYLNKYIPGIIWTDYALDIVDRWYYSSDGKESC